MGAQKGLQRRAVRSRAKAFFAFLFALLAAVLTAWAWTQWQINRDAPAVSAAEARRGFVRAISWLQANEGTVLSQGNAALWWMLDVAAQRSADPYLTDLVERHLQLAYQGELETSAWKRLIRPRSMPVASADPVEALEPYQRFFLSAAKCRIDDQTRAFYAGHVCRPALTKVWADDSVCSTHHLMGLMVHRRNQCPEVAGMLQLQQELLDDIEGQARWEPFMRDAVLQRTLMLAWVGGPERPRASWVRRAIAAQQPDGGWSGAAALPEWPDLVQPWAWKAWLRKPSGGALSDRPPSDFHASAQGLLLTALIAYPSGKSGLLGD